MKKQNVGRLAGVALFFLNACTVHAEWFDQGPVFSITEENDVIGNEDRHYSQAFKLAYLHTDNDAPDWLKRWVYGIPSWGFTPHAVKIGAEIGQSIYTPDNLEATQVVANDRPYAGWLYTGFILQRRGLAGGKWPLLESFQLDIGIVGPESLAEDAQEWAHRSRPRGWDNQLDTEMGIALKYMRAWLLSPQRDGPRKFDFIPHAGFSAGNINTSFRVGVTVRAGINLPNDFGPQTINSLATTEGGCSPGRQTGRCGFYVFGGVEGSAVAYNEFLDGNVFRDSHSVTREPWVAEMKCGIAITTSRVDIGAAAVWDTNEFTKQRDADFYGTLFVKVKL